MINKRTIWVAVFMLLPFCLHGQEEPMEQVVRRGLTVAKEQSLLLAKSLENEPDRLPRMYEQGELKTCGYRAWVSGFYPGVLWYMYENEPDPTLRRYAEQYTARVEPAKELTSTHDLGFMLYCSFGNGYRLTQNPHYLEVMKTGAASLASRFDPRIGVIKSWNTRARWQYPVIIDNLMNLEFLVAMGKQTGDSALIQIANTHAQTTMRHHFRPDNSCYHVVSYDTLTGQPHFRGTHQGYSDASAWARGQAWALYGYTMMYRETRRTEYLEQALRVARYLRDHPRLPADGVPYWDFDTPAIPNAPRDASAAAVMASALIELSQYDPTPEAAGWLALAQKQLRTLSSPEYLAEPGTHGGFILKHSVGNHNKNSEVDVPLTYADYYYVEALLRLKRLMASQGSEARRYWLQTMLRIADPVLQHISQGTLTANLPFESLSDSPLRRQVFRLEAFGRTLCGIAPWLELGADDTEEGRLRDKYIRMSLQGIRQAVDPASPDYLVFDGRHSQALVDAAFLAQGLLRAPKQLWGKLDAETRSRMVAELKRTRVIQPKESNWLLFASMVETALLDFTGEYDEQRLYYGINRFLNEWYKGDAWYGDGAEFHLDYYNSIVIHPMLTDILSVLQKHNLPQGDAYAAQLLRHQRLAAQLERLISPEGSYPVVGRSIVYRFGVFHALSQLALLDRLPEKLHGAAVRSALTAVMRRQLTSEANFDAEGWLRVGFAGSQLHMSEPYINTGSLYMCMAAFLPLGLPADHPFWTAPDEPWTNAKAWQGIDVGADKALRGK